MTPLRTPAPETRTSVVRELRPLRAAGQAAATDAHLVGEIRSGSTTAAGTLFDRYHGHVERLVWSLLGPEPEAEDVLHEIFVRALEGIDSVEDPSRLKGWLTGITVYTAREWIRRRTRRKWLRFVDELPEPPTPAASEEVSQATRCTFDVLSAMSESDRIFFSLRFIEGMELSEVALACDVSLSTAKRRLKDAERHFITRAKRHEALRPWLDEGRWAIEGGER
ncbi:MAG: RNA polymerase sigma factor [Labilithrix sp.]|nr:RNA polymerase sigma factor [Labilithrix sp.]MCW5836108.1 RNA polymerase sigma factor [Labilithrix sp.]